MEVVLNDDAVKEIVTAAIMKQLDDPQQLVSEAVKYLISTKKVGDAYNAKEVQPIQEAFHNAIERHATRVIQDFLQDNEDVNKAILEIAEKALSKFFENDSLLLADAVAATLSKKLSEAKLGRWD